MFHMWAIGPEIQQVINKWKIQNIYSCDRLTHHYHPLEFLISQAHYSKMNTHNLFLFIFVLLLLFIQSSVQSLHRVRLFATPWSAARQASLYITNSQSLLKLISIELVMPFNHLTLCHAFLLLLSIFLSIRVYSNECDLTIRWPKHWSFSFSISPSNEYSGLIYFRMDWLDCLTVQGTLKSLLQYHSSKASILQHSAFFIVQFSHPYMTTGKTTTLTRQTFVGKVISK